VIPAWWDRYADLLQDELDAFQQAGMPATIDVAWREGGLIRLSFTYECDGELIPLYAIYPDLYPFVRAQVYADGLDLPRHRNPFIGNLCLIGRSTENWSTEDRLADLVLEQMPKLIAAARRPPGTPSPVAEEAQAEPVTGYLPETPNSLVLIDSSWTISPEVDEGTLTLVVESGWLGIKAYVRRIAGGGVEIGGLDLEGVWQRPKTIQGRWVRLPDLRGTFDPRELERLVLEAHPGLRRLNPQNTGELSVDVVGLTFPEELSAGFTGDGWLFLLRVPGGPRKGTYLARAGRAGAADFAERVPELMPLRSKTVLLVGLGGIGAPVALEFLRGGVRELRVVDPDIVDPGTAVRWPLGVAYAGECKVAALKRFAAANWPNSTVMPHPIGIGRVRGSIEEPSERESVDGLLSGVDLIFDATAELGIHRLLSELAWERGIAYVEAATRNGAWGGTVARVIPEAGRGCHVCLEYVMAERVDDPALAVSVKPGGLQQPTGCADPTFTGTGFDVASIALAGVRLAVATLCQGWDGAYPDQAWDGGVVNFRDQSGAPIAPMWSTFRLDPHPSCTRQH